LILALVAAGCGGYGGAGTSGDGDHAGDPTVAAAAPRADTKELAPVLESQVSGTTALLQAVSPVDENVVWVGGHRGTWARTLDGGATWTAGGVPGADTLQFRDVHAHSADIAWLLSAGSGDLSRIYRTDDGGSSWTLQWTNDEPDGFYDCIDFWSAELGVAYGDAVGGELRIVRTVDGGVHWERLAGSALPEAQPGEGGFAASGTCLVTGDAGRGWAATGNAARARVLHTSDWGASWTVFDTQIPGGEAAGLFSVSFRDSLTGVIFGGSLARPDDPAEADGSSDAESDPAAPPRVAVSRDGGASWDAAGQPAFSGAIFGGAWVPDYEPPAMVAVAPTGAAWSVDEGDTWFALDSAAYWGLGFASPEAGWLVGPEGRITKVRFDRP
jgi:photosystem II stability/assembly factor-like uncharacterized protein